MTPASIWQQGRPSPVADLIASHRAELERVWERHGYELRNPLPYEPPGKGARVPAGYCGVCRKPAADCRCDALRRHG